MDLAWTRDISFHSGTSGHHTVGSEGLEERFV